MAISTKHDYETAMAVTNELLREWDPYGLIAGGSRADEFEGEAQKIVAQLRRVSLPTEMTRIVADTFSESFGSEEFSPKNCELVANQLFRALVENGIIDASE